MKGRGRGTLASKSLWVLGFSGDGILERWRGGVDGLVLAVGLSWTGDGLGCSMGCLRPAEMDGKVAGCECGVGGRLKGCGEGAVE